MVYTRHQKQLNWNSNRIHLQERGTNQDVDEGSDDDGPVSAEERVGDESPDQRRERRRARPGVHVRRRRGRGLAERPRQVSYQVRRDPVVREPLRHFHT